MRLGLWKVIAVVLAFNLFALSACFADDSPVDLLGLIDVNRDTVTGDWKMGDDGLVVSIAKGLENARLSIPYAPPDEYDLTMQFTRLAGHDTVTEMFKWGDSMMLWGMGAGGKRLALTTGTTDVVKEDDPNISKVGVLFTTVIKVRASSVEVFVNDKLVASLDQPQHGVKLRARWGLQKGSELGVGAWYGVPIRITKIELLPVSGAGKPTRDATPTTRVAAVEPSDSEAGPGPTTRAANPQATVKALEVYETDSGMMLGQTSEAVLTITRGTKAKPVSVRFVTTVDSDMNTVRDELLRYIHLTYPNWYADSAELTFEDKYVKHGGGSIGAAIGTLIRSCIEGFEIDSNAAITGDISANGKVRPIGGVSAKLRGAVASKCTVVAVPTDNFEQLEDTLVYSGVPAISDVQIIGIASLNDAVAVMRTDRDPKLSEAVDLFSQIQQKLHDEVQAHKPALYIHSKDAAEKLSRVLELAPNHLSAKLLSEVAQNKQPRTLSIAASEYYTFVAVHGMLAVLKEHGKSEYQSIMTPTAVKQGLNDLHKLRGIADPGVRPLIDAWSRFIEAWNSVEQGGSLQAFDRQRQAVLDEMAKLQADQDLMQKMLKEGI